MQRGLGLLFLFSLLLPLTVRSQAVQNIPGWEVLPDSLMQVWHLDKDQIRRINVIEEDYATERDEVWSTPDMEEQDKVQQLVKLGAARMEEIKGVLGTTHYENWQAVLRSAVPNR
ncbi:MAG: hypothetical protein WBB32_03140 [Flavobacteriales bacterium]